MKTVQLAQRGGGRKWSADTRSLERGLSILRVFRAGTSLWKNGDLADRTGLPRSTVSRLTRTLVACGFLDYDRIAHAYRLGAAVLGLAESWMVGSDVPQLASPIMQTTADRLNVNISLAVPDIDQMVYLHTIRKHEDLVPRRVTIGHRTLIEVSSLGHAYLATLPASERASLLRSLQKRYTSSRWGILAREIRKSIQHVHQTGYCRPTVWLPGIIALATPIQIVGRSPYFVALTAPLQKWDEPRIQEVLVPALLELAAQIKSALLGSELPPKRKAQRALLDNRVLPQIKEALERRHTA
jgi:DNA-binding IclR family transcriptional regulator